MQFHSDSSRIKWKLAVVKSLIRGTDDYIARANSLKQTRRSTAVKGHKQI